MTDEVSDTVQLLVPDLGDFEDVEVIEVLVSVGDTVVVEDPLVTIETDKASMDVPAETAGRIVSLEVEVGSKVSTGSLVATIEVEDGVAVADPPARDEPTQVMSEAEITAAIGKVSDSVATHNVQLVVIGSGPGGYTAAFRAADLGLDVILVERDAVLGWRLSECRLYSVESVVACRKGDRRSQGDARSRRQV